ncbi:hypothetical protein LZ554_001284 [Drepanopeziza brunnea f. sp. 'monogermtubi']|nr:hypothetical protein LZ554_001284 [Drepanopeziza brunnea f. sp. 'monogermtubi']
MPPGDSWRLALFGRFSQAEFFWETKSQSCTARKNCMVLGKTLLIRTPLCFHTNIRVSQSIGRRVYAPGVNGAVLEHRPRL